MNVSFANVLTTQSTLHPSLTPQDAIKLCYQASFGAEHLFADPIGAQGFFEQEYATLCPALTNEPLYEQISPDFCRINLRAWKAKGLPPLWLFRLFYHSMVTPNTPSLAIAATTQSTCNATNTEQTQRFQQYAAQIRAQSAAGALPFSVNAWDAAYATYLQGGLRAVHHSAAYRAAEQPAYRLIHLRFLAYLPLLEHLAAQPTPANDKSFIIAIDGRCGAGKTTLAQTLCAILQVDAIQLDDFFLPPEKRTPERLATPGGNVDYERFTNEVLPHLSKQKAFAYQKFSCATMQLGDIRQIGASPWRVIEGSYSHHPALGEYADLRVFVTIDAHAQLARIRKRNGEAWAEDFKQKWIPLEESYFAAYDIAQNAMITLRNRMP